MITLSPGQRSRLPDIPEISFTLSARGKGAAELKGALFGLSPGKLGESTPLGIVAAGHPEDMDGVMRWDKKGAHLSLKRAPRGGERFLFAAWLVEEARRSAKHLSDFKEITLALKASKEALFTFTLAGTLFTQETAAILGEIYFKSGAWRFKAAGDGFVGGLPSMAHRLGLNGPQRDRLSPGGARREEDAGRQGGGGGLLGGHRPPNQRPSRGSGLGSSAGTGADLNQRIRPPRGWPGGQPLKKIPRDLLHAVARVECQTAEGIHGGTAFAITPGGCLLTCHHVVEGVEQMGVQFHGDDAVRGARVLASDQACDLALIQLQDAWGVEHWLKLNLGEAPPDLGDEVGLVGFPLAPQIGHEINFSRGIINSIRHPSDTLKVLQIDAGAAPGSSGGPIFRLSDGLVLGVLSSGLSGVGGMLANFAADVGALVPLGWLEG